MAAHFKVDLLAGQCLSHVNESALCRENVGVSGAVRKENVRISIARFMLHALS